MLHRCLNVLFYCIITITIHFATSSSLGRHHTPIPLSLLLSKQQFSTESENNRNAIKQTISELVTGVPRRVAHQILQHSFYWITAMDTIFSVFLNEYSGFGTVALLQNEKQGVVREVYSKLFYFARMRPRLLYSIGALVRALSLCTPLKYLVDPSVGVGAGIHLFAYLAGARWVKPLILGWATTKWFWCWLGARPVDRAYIPITLSIHEWEKKGKKYIKMDGTDR